MSETLITIAPTDDRPMLVRPRLGFLGVGWIGLHRLEAIAQSGAGEIVAVADSSAAAVARARTAAPGAAEVPSLEALLDAQLDGLVIATPSAAHAEQAIAALERGVAVFCQKPLARTEAETRRVVEAARAADRLLAVDLSYRFTDAMAAVHEVARSGELGELFAAELVFHNAYGPDKPWFRDPALAGGGCVMDLGIHLIDLALWILGTGEGNARVVSSHLYADGRPLERPPEGVEDYALATLECGDAVVRIACSWNAHAGTDAIIAATFLGTRGGASMRNVNGSFYDLVAEQFTGTARRTLVEPPDPWGGRTAVQWAAQLGRGDRFDPAAGELVAVARLLDMIYGR